MATLSATRTVLRKTKQTKRPVRNPKGRSQSITAPICGNDYLNHSFSPVQSEVYPGLHDIQLVQTAFFKSLKNLSALYGLEYKRDLSTPYPQNMISAFENATNTLATKSKLELVLMQNEHHVATVATVKYFDLNDTLYHIPVAPLHKLLENEAKKESANLLLSIFSYLYKVHRVAYFTDDSSYLYYVYDRMETNTHEDRDYEIENEKDGELAKEQEEWYRMKCEQFCEVFQEGATLLKLIQQNVHLTEFQKRFDTYAPETEPEKMLKVSAEIALNLYHQFPNRSFRDRINTELLDEDDDEDRRHLRVGEYLSFFWSDRDCLYDELWDWVNSELQESTLADVPMTCQYFNVPHRTEQHDFSFETQFINLLDELADTLRNPEL